MQIGIDDPSLLGAIAAKVGLSGHAAVAVADDSAGTAARAAAEKAYGEKNPFRYGFLEQDIAKREIARTLAETNGAWVSTQVLAELANVGHIPHLEAREQFHSILLRFLAK